MTAVLTRESWFGTRTAPPEVGLAPGQLAAVLAEEFREIPRSGHPLAMQPVVVPRDSYRELMGATAEILALLRRTVLGLAADRTGRMAALGLGPDNCPMFTPDEEFELRHCADMARADVVISRDGPRFVEVNVSGAFGGLVPYQLYRRAWRRIRELAGRPAYHSVDASALVARLVQRTCAELGVPASAVYVGTPRDWGPHTTTRYFDVQVEMLRAHGVPATHLDFEELLAGLDLPGGPPRWPLGIAAFTVEDAEEVGYDIGPARVALDHGLRMVPSQSSTLLHTKNALALLSEGQPWMSAHEKDLVRHYVPWSRVVGDRPVSWRGAGYDLPRLLVQRQDRFVLKGVTSYSCQEVFFGATTTEADWAALVERAVRGGGYIAQERVDTVPYPLEVMAASGDVARISADLVVSPFCLGGVSAGCYVRFVEADGPTAIGGEAAMRGCLLAEA
jgi:hypothetical protein